MGDFLFCFVRTNFCDWEKLVFLSGNKFLGFSGSRFSIWNYSILVFQSQQSNVYVGEQHADI